MLLPRREKHGFKIRIEGPVHAGELEFVFEIGDRAQAAQHHARILLAHELGEQTLEADDAQVLHIGQNFLRDVDALLQGEERPLGAAVGNAENQAVEQPAGAPHQILMAARERIERSRIHRFDHGCSSLAFHCNSW